MVLDIFMSKDSLIETWSQRTWCLVLIMILRLQILVLLDQLMEEMEKEPAAPTWVLWITWHQKFTWAKTMKVNLLIFLPQQLFCSLWCQSTHHSLQLSQMTHSTDAWPLKELTFSGRLTWRKKNQIFTVNNSRILFKACFIWIQLPDLQWNKYWLILGCKGQLHPSKRLKKNLGAENLLLIRLLKQRSKKRRANRNQDMPKEWWEVVEPARRKPNKSSNLSKSHHHQKNYSNTKRFLPKIPSISLHVIQTWLKKPLFSTWKKKSTLTQKWTKIITRSSSSLLQRVKMLMIKRPRSASES